MEKDWTCGQSTFWWHCYYEQWYYYCHSYCYCRRCCSVYFYQNSTKIINITTTITTNITTAITTYCLDDSTNNIITTTIITNVKTTLIFAYSDVNSYYRSISSLWDIGMIPHKTFIKIILFKGHSSIWLILSKTCSLYVYLFSVCTDTVQ